MSCAAQAVLKSRTTAARSAADGAGGWSAARIRRRADEASWRQAASVRPTTPATSANG